MGTLVYRTDGQSGGLGEAGIGAASGAAPLPQAAHGAGDLQARRHVEAATPHLGDSQGRKKGTDRLSRKANPRATPLFLPWAPDKASP